MSGVISEIGSETLDGADCPESLVRATLTDLARSNALFGARAAVWYGVKTLVGAPGTTREQETGNGSRGGARATVSVLDVGAGAGDIMSHLVRRASREGVRLVPLAADRHRAAAALCRERGLCGMIADAWSLPVRERSVDVVIASQVLHHFHPDAAVDFLRRIAPLARRGVVIADLRRARFAAAGIWMAGLALRFHPVTRRDGVTSVRRGFTARGLEQLLSAAGLAGRVYRRPGYRLVGVWRRLSAHD